MGHAADGKAYGPYQRACQSLARLGFAVLAFDPIGQGERVNYPRDGANATRLPSVDDEHSVPGKQLLLVGDTCSELQLWDAIRSLDVLADHERVDNNAACVSRTIRRSHAFDDVGCCRSTLDDGRGDERQHGELCLPRLLVVRVRWTMPSKTSSDLAPWVSTGLTCSIPSHQSPC